MDPKLRSEKGTKWLNQQIADLKEKQKKRDIKKFRNLKLNQYNYH